MTYYERHKERLLEYQKAYNQANSDTYLEYQKDYYANVIKPSKPVYVRPVKAVKEKPVKPKKEKTIKPKKEPVKEVPPTLFWIHFN